MSGLTWVKVTRFIERLSKTQRGQAGGQYKAGSNWQCEFEGHGGTLLKGPATTSSVFVVQRAVYTRLRAVAPYRKQDILEKRQTTRRHEDDRSSSSIPVQRIGARLRCGLGGAKSCRDDLCGAGHSGPLECAGHDSLHHEGRSWAAVKDTCYYPVDLQQNPGIIPIARSGSGQAPSRAS